MNDSRLRQWLQTSTDAELVDGWPHVINVMKRRKQRRRIALATVIALIAVVLVISLRPAPIPDAVQVARSAVVPRVIRLSSGTDIVVMPGSRLRRLGQGDLHWSLDSGRAAFSVQKSDRHFVVEAGSTRVQVLGTRFVVDRSEEEVHVRVEEGRVEVIDPDGTRIVDGQDSSPTWPRLAASTDKPRRPPVSAERPKSDSIAADSPPRKATLRSNQQRGLKSQPKLHPAAQTPNSIPDSAGVRKTEALPATPGPPDVASQMAEADTARARGDDVEAAKILRNIVESSPQHAQAPLAAVMLARLEVDALNTPALAAAHLTWALKAGLPRVLQEGARARLVQAHLKAGDEQSAREVAQDYLREHPNGRQIKEIRRWAW